MGLINNKEKQAAGHNWGADKWQKQHTIIPDPLIPNRPMYKSSRKKKKKEKKPYVWKACPFCGIELPLLPEEEIKKLEKSSFSVYLFAPRVKVCPDCGAKEVHNCPCCHKQTWMSKDFIYKHQLNIYSCGFVGKSLQGLPLLDHPQNRKYPELV